MSEIIERLQFEASSYQESFHLLSKANNLKDLAKNFFRILRGSLMLTKMNIYFRQKETNDWQELLIKDSTFDITGHENSKPEAIIFPEGDYKGVFTILPMVDGSVFAIMLGTKLSQAPYDDYDQLSIQRFSLLLGSAYQVYINRIKEKELVFSLNQRVLQLNSLVETGIEISRLGRGGDIMRLALKRVVSLTNASRGMLRITEKNRVVDKIYFPARFKERVVEKKSDLIESGFHFDGKRYMLKLFEKESRHGAVSFETTDQLLLDSFTRQVHVTLENHDLHQQALEKQKIEQDVAVAATIQQRIIPETLPNLPGYDIAGVNIPTKFVGGDYYDCIPLADNRYALIIADVSGKGIPASLLVSSLNASLIAYLDADLDLPTLAKKLNMVIYNASTLDKYITFYMAILDAKTGELESLNAGHNQIYLLKKNKLIELKVGGLPFGMMEIGFPYQSEKHVIEPGDRLVLYTDGVTEAMNENEEEFDDVISFEKYVKKNAKPDVPAQVFIDQLMKEIEAFTGDTPQSDDITAMYLIREE